LRPSQQPDDHVLHGLNFSKIILPSAIGLGVVLWLMYRQLDVDELLKIEYTYHAYIWLFLAVLVYFLRHAFYAWRLRIISDNFFGWLKSFELITIWDFSSAISPTSVGGSGVAMYFLSQEKLSGGKTVALVLYSMVLDTIFIILSLIGFYLIFGPVIIRPGAADWSDLQTYGVTIIAVFTFMLVYGILFFYGLFINPAATKRFLFILSKIPFLKRFRYDLRKTGLDMVEASLQIREKPAIFHFKSFVATSGAWLCRFLIVNFLILAVISASDLTLYDHLLIIARGDAMYNITAFSPTPGGSGVAEYLFGGFYTEYIPAGIASIVTLLWRLITYYTYLIAGAIIIPNWIRKLIQKRRLEKEQEEQQTQMYI
jgi:uncharacterized protein (TIRG00374 family)